MSEPRATDVWHEWLLKRRSGGNAALAEYQARELAKVRDRVLDYAKLRGGETVLDVGCGDGLIAFGALDRIGADGRIIFSDISQPLLDEARAAAEAAGPLDRCQFVAASADNLGTIADASVDVVTTRSVLIYVRDKPRSFAEFFRVLRPGGRISIFEPINRISIDDCGEHRFWGIDVTAVQDVAARVRALYMPEDPDSDPMLGFDERDLVRMAEDAGFASVHLTYEYTWARGLPEDAPPPNFDTLANTAPNPLAPTLAEAMAQTLSPDERARLEAHMRAELAARRIARRSAVAYLRAGRP